MAKKNEQSNTPGVTNQSGGQSINQAAGLYAAVCADCGRECAVKHRSHNDAPVYCANCYKQREHTVDGEDF